MEQTEHEQLAVVCDAGPIIHLDELGCLGLLADFSKVLVPEAVWKEVNRHRPAALTSPSASLLQIAAAGEMSGRLADIARLFSLHVGEMEALQIASERRTDIFLTDDTAASMAAKQLAIPVHGTLGILLSSIRRGQRTARQVEYDLRNLPKTSTLHVKPTLLIEVLAIVQEIPDA